MVVLFFVLNKYTFILCNFNYYWPVSEAHLKILQRCSTLVLVNFITNTIGLWIRIKKKKVYVVRSVFFLVLK